ncbi:helix-turn-helix domain-containing protein [Burkholderia sp. Ac-20349]|uniref:winged helix-turn-helix transcriptional regulator n=1 Tax=Burkholderia sp. Ac-20349 TaxID=2703893 RepID=UPI00197C085A|nr:helix-turn-helix domain-containing protein [Burkholderia sp. Ac-20349]MBN3839404.1 helix-turn-helix transcriptional regulator [Burkholderia sp. Ac-20349]
MNNHTDHGVPPRCPPTEAELNEFRQAIDIIRGKWKVEIMWVLLDGSLRFGEVRKALPGITQHMLTAQLRALEADGLVNRTAYAEIPPRVEYVLTDHARALKPIFVALTKWATSLRSPEKISPESSD